MLSKAVFFDAANQEALYNLGMAYKGNGDEDKAVATFTKFTELFPDTDRAERAKGEIAKIQAAAN